MRDGLSLPTKENPSARTKTALLRMEAGDNITNKTCSLEDCDSNATVMKIVSHSDHILN